MDLRAACAGFCYALASADALVRARAARHALVVGSERMTGVIDR
jgi:3-oxoacyl-[acyl-carrier-protein] synthase-3